MQYMLLHAIDEGREWDEGHVAETQSLLGTWLEETMRRKVNLQGSRLRPTSDATTVRVRDGDVMVTDGPFAEAKEQLAGYDVLLCENAQEALDWAAKHPTARMGSIEVRPFFEDLPIETLPEQRPETIRYMLLVCVDESVQLTPEEGSRMGPATEAWVADTESRGIRLYGNRLAPLHTAHTVRVKDDRVIVVDGPFAETKEQIAGFDVLECADLDEALAVASTHPVASFGALEIRPFWRFGEN